MDSLSSCQAYLSSLYRPILSLHFLYWIYTVYCVYQSSHWLLYKINHSLSIVRVYTQTVCNAVLFGQNHSVKCIISNTLHRHGTTELSILCWSEIIRRKLTSTSATAHYSGPDNAIWLVAQCLSKSCTDMDRKKLRHCRRLCR